MNHYGWYTIPPSVHKLLEHSYVIASYFDLSIGFYSEEAQECQHKEIRHARLNHASKISRFSTMRDQFHYLMVRSDPVISSISFVKHKSFGGKPLNDEVLQLLQK